MTASRLGKRAQAVHDALAASGLAFELVELPASTRTAKEAAEAVGCTVAQIAKSIVFTAAPDRAVLVIASGVNRIDESALAARVGAPLQMATPEFVRRHTGYAIGGVPPCAHAESLDVFIDRDLLRFDRVWAAAGTPNAVFSLAPGDLHRLTGGTVLAVA